VTAPRKVCVVLVDRANYGRLKPVMRAIADHPGLELQVLCGGTMVLERFDRPVRVVQADGFRVDGEVFLELEGSTPVTMAKSVGFGVIEFASHLQRLQPDVVLVIGDRYEALGAAIAAAYMNLTLVHVQGGEVSGSIDESARHAITKLAHFHYPSTRRSADYIVRMGERPETILGVGCPSSDIARTLDRSLRADVLNGHGGGAILAPDKDFLLVLFHPATTEYGGETAQMEQVLASLHETAMPTVLLWPNIDAGSNHISKVIRVFRERHKPTWLRTITNFTPEDYMRVLANAACAVGNSSSFVRDASFLGTPVVLVGSRQDGRETAEHVTRVPPEKERLVAAIRAQLAHGRYAASDLYGDGHVAPRIAAALAELTPYVQKRLYYPA
jgi:UDP-hydrolysing UDP-N-acetyl-D-glucosamine 2-epimerase